MNGGVYFTENEKEPHNYDCFENEVTNYISPRASEILGLLQPEALNTQLC